jgi:lipopolysaccharide export system protein LptA
MRKSEAAKYARWSAAVALLLAGLTVGVYLKRGWTRLVERRNAPPAPAVDVERQSSYLTFSKVEQNRTVFTVQASKSIDFKGLNASDLEGVKITIFGKDGARHDTMETHTCRYTKDNGNVVCAGDVEIILMSAEEWKAAGSGAVGKSGTTGTMKVETRGVSFNRASGEAKTEDKVRFEFANGKGEAVGAEYHSEEGTLRLQRNVKLNLDPPEKVEGKSEQRGMKKEPVEVTGTRMDFSRDAGTMYLSGPAEAKTHSARLTAAALLLEFDGNLHAKRLVAKSDEMGSRPQFTSQKGLGREKLSADEITATFAPQGWITQADAAGQVSGESERDEDLQTVKAQSASIEMLPGMNAPKLLTLRGGVDARMSQRSRAAPAEDTSSARRVTSEELRIAFAEPVAGKGARIAHADTPGAGRIEWNEGANATAKGSQTAVQANQLAMQFDAAGKVSRLDAKGDVRTDRSVVGVDQQTATAKEGFVEMQTTGGWSRMELSEEVKLKEGTRAAQADRAVFGRAEQTVTLTGRAMVRDATSLTSAQKLTLWQVTGDVKAEGGVRSSDLSARSASVHLAPVASNVSADQLNGNSRNGRALYSGHARLWQGNSVLEAESIELLKNERILNAVGNVRAVFPQVPRNSSAAPMAAKQPVLWHAQSARLTYWDQENRAKLEQHVVVQSPDEKINSGTLDLYFTRADGNGDGPGNTKVVASNGAGVPIGAQQINRAVGSGGVTVQQGDRRATADRGEYTATDGKFVMSGGTPTLFDASQGTTTGRQLTFFLADATIIVDSENGSRTLTKHRVEKQ